MAIDVDCRKLARGGGHNLELDLEEYLLKALYGRRSGFGSRLEAEENGGGLRVR